MSLASSIKFIYYTVYTPNPEDPKLVKDKNDIHLRELQGSLLDRTGLEVSKSTLCRQLNRLKLGRQKKFNSQLTDI